MTLIRLNPKDFSLERDVLGAKVLALHACEIIVPNIKDILMLKEFFEQTCRLFEMNSKNVQIDELGLLAELRCESLRATVKIIVPLLKFKKQYLEYTHIMQTAVMDQS